MNIYQFIMSILFNTYGERQAVLNAFVQNFKKEYPKIKQSYIDDYNRRMFSAA